jgi:hypothetical protein
MTVTVKIIWIHGDTMKSAENTVRTALQQQIWSFRRAALDAWQSPDDEPVEAQILLLCVDQIRMLVSLDGDHKK